MSFELYDYQKAANTAVYDHWRNGAKAVILQLATGGGKSKTSGHIISQGEKAGRRVWICAHREELIEQLYGTVTGDYGLDAGIIKAGYPLRDRLVQVCSIQTLIRRLDDLMACAPNLLIFDEAHRSASKSYQRVVNAFARAKVLGLTATPVRNDGKALGDYYDAIVLGPSIPELIGKGKLVPPRYVHAQDDYGDRVIGSSKGDYKPSDLSKIIHEVHREGNLVDTWFEYARGRSTVVFAVDRQDGESICEAYNKYPECKAVFVDWESDKIHGKGYRKSVFAAAKAGEITHLVNVNIATEGVDVPEWSCVQLGRKTKSLALYFQMVGRGLRIAPWAEKADCMVLDHAGISDGNNPDSLGFVTDPRDWSLAPSVPKQKRQTAAEKKREAAGLQVEKLVIENGEVIMVEVPYGDRPEWMMTLEQLLRRKAESGYKPLWVAHKLIDQHPELDLPELKVVAKALNFKWQWAQHFLDGVKRAA